MNVLQRLQGFLQAHLCPDQQHPGSPDESLGPAYPPVVLPERLASNTQRLLRSFHGPREGREGLVYWVGRARGRGGVVTTLVVPDADAGYGHVETSPSENAAVIQWLDRWDLELLGQAHSHPPGAGAVHSPGDDRMTFSPFEGQVSVVVADHARNRDRYLDDWGIHRFMEGRFADIPLHQQNQHLRIVPSIFDRRPDERGAETTQS